MEEMEADRIDQQGKVERATATDQARWMAGNDRAGWVSEKAVCIGLMEIVTRIV
jgi:hypothetical protein